MAEYINREDALNFEMSVVVDPDDMKAIVEGMNIYYKYLESLPITRIEVVEADQTGYSVRRTPFEN